MNNRVVLAFVIIGILSLSLIFELSGNKLKIIKIIADRKDFEKVYNEINLNKNQNVIKSYNAIKKRADEILEESLCQYEVDEGNRMLDVSRKCKETIEILGFTTKLMELENKEFSQIEKYTKRAIEELVNVSNFQDWHPSHFLDTAEMTYSVALGYNWFYEYLTTKEKQVIENAIINNGLIPGICMENTRQFVNKNDNWNHICNGALGIGAITLLNIDRDIELKEKNIDDDFCLSYLKISKEKIKKNQYEISLNRLCYAIINRTVDKIPLVYEEMQDGAYEEGTLYWEYGNSYLINFLATAKLNFGSTFDLIKEEYFKNTILYPVYLTGKSSNILSDCKLYNYGDADEYIVNTSASTWLANMYYKDEKLSQIINWYQENFFETQNIYQLLWQNYGFSLKNETAQDIKRILNTINDKQYSKTEIAILQNSILDKNGFYIAINAGKNANTIHSDLDAGSFILDAKGTRWIEDPGRENYNVSKYWDRKYSRWTYYKKRAESHSTIILKTDNNEDQKINADCKMLEFVSNKNISSIRIDISDVYNFKEQENNSIIRKISLDKMENKVVLEDNINLQKENDIYSMFNISKDTNISLENNNSTAILKKNVLQQDGRYKEETLKINIIDSNYKWTIIPKKPMNSDLTDISKNADFKYNLKTADEEKLCIKIENGKNENIKVEIY